MNSRRTPKSSSTSTEPNKKRSSRNSTNGFKKKTSGGPVPGRPLHAAGYCARLRGKTGAVEQLEELAEQDKYSKEELEKNQEDTSGSSPGAGFRDEGDARYRKGDARASGLPRAQYGLPVVSARCPTCWSGTAPRTTRSTVTSRGPGTHPVQSQGLSGQGGRATATAAGAAFHDAPGGRKKISSSTKSMFSWTTHRPIGRRSSSKQRRPIRTSSAP